MSDSDASLPLPSPADSGGGDIDDKVKSASRLGHGTDDSNSDSGSSPGKIPTPSTPKNGRDSMAHSLTLLEDIPYPTDVDTSQVPNQDHDDIPLPPDSSRYSPSQVTPGDDENESMMSPSESTESSSIDKKPSTVTMKVLGSAQAKKRLLAFSASKQAAVSYSPLNKKISPLKGVSVFHQAANKKEISKEQTLAIASIKEEETKMKEILAMNSILNEKLKQVKSITENIPKAPPITAVVNPTVVTSENFRISDINSKLIEEEMFSKKSSASANSRNLRKKRTSSSSRSRSRSHSLSKSPSVDSRSRKRDKHSRSRSRGRERDKDRRDRDRSDRDRIRGKEKKSSNRKSRSRSRSPKIKKEKKRSKSRSRSPKHKRDKEKDKSKKRSKSRSHSRDRGSRKRSPKIESRKEYDSRDRERSRLKEKEREIEREKEKERERKESEKKREEEKKREREEAAEKELDKVRKVRMPYDWPDYDVHQYRPTDIHKLWGAIVIKSSRSKSPTQSDAKGSNPSKEVPQPTPLSKTLSKQLKSMNVVPVESANGGSKDYPTAFIKNTKCKPSITYGCNTLTYSGYYKSRQQVFKEEEADVMHAMSEIISQKGSTVKQFPSSSDVWKSKKKQQEWFAPADQVFCPSEGSKGIVISHLYSDDEGEDSPAGSLKGRKPTNDRSVEITPIPVLQQKSPSSPDSMDSAPSPLLKQKYNSDEPSAKDSTELNTEISNVEPRGKRDSGSYAKTSSDEEVSRKRESKKSEKLSTNPPEDKDREKTRKSEKIESDKGKASYSEDDKPASNSRRNDNKDVSPKIQDEEDDDMYEEMELEEFPLEKEIAANLKTSDKEKKDKDKHKGKESKDKSKKAKKQKRKKKHHKSKDKHEKKKSSDDEDEDFEGHDSSDADSARLKTPKKSSKKDKNDKTAKEKRHRKRRSKTDSSKGSESSSDSEHSDDSARKRPKKKRSKLSAGDDVALEKSVDTKKSKSTAAHESLVSQPVVEKEKSRKEKKKKNEKSKSKKKHSKKNRSSSSSSTESTESESSSSTESSSDTSDEASGEDRKAKKADKKKKSKKDKKESKKDKVRDKSPDSSDDENHRRGGGRRDDRGGGGNLGGGSGRSGGHYHKEGRDRDQSYRERERDRGSEKRSNYGRRRNGEFGELFDSLGDWDSASPLQPKDSDVCAGLTPIPTESLMEQTGKLSHASKEAHELLTAIDNDLLLQSVLMNEDLSAETLLKQITEPTELDRSAVSSKSVYNLPTAPAPSNWSDDSEEENAAAAATEKTDVTIPAPSSGYGTERSTDTLKDAESDEKSDGSDSSSEDSSDSDSSSTSSDSQSDSDSNNAKEKTDLSDVKDSEIKSNESKVPSLVPVLYDPFADNSDATSASSDSEKKVSVEGKREKINRDTINTEDVYKEDNKFYEDLKNTMDVLNKYENKVDVSSCKDITKECENSPLKTKDIEKASETPTKTLDKGLEISPGKLLNFKISGSKLDKSSLTAFGTEENVDDVKATMSHGTKPKSPPKKEKAIPVITSKDHVEQFPISVLGSTCNKIAPIPNVTMFTEEHINLGVDNYRCDSRESHERNRYIKPVASTRSRSRSYSRSPSRSRSRSFSPHRRVPAGAPPPCRFHRGGSYERERAIGRPHRRRSPPPEFFHGRRQYGGDRRRHYHHQGYPGDMMSRRRERERFRGPLSRSKSRSRSRSRSISRSRSRSISPRSHGPGFHHRPRRVEMFERDRRGRGNYFEPRDHRERRYVRDRDYHDRERSRTPDHLSPTELRMRKKHCDFMDDRLSHDDRLGLKNRETKLVTDNDGELVPVAQKQESPPLQLNVADSTISDSELASRNDISQINAGNIYIGGISREMLIDHHNSGHMELPHPGHSLESHVGHLPPQSLDNDLCSDYNSPPRRLSLDERLEMEMGISLRDEPINKAQQVPGGYYYPPNAYRLPGHEHPDQGKYLPVLPHPQTGVPELGHHPGVIANAWNPAGKPQRTQIVQVGNVIQVVPSEISAGPITITSSSKSRRSSSSERKKQSVPKRVITIQVPIVPFTVPFIQTEDSADVPPPQLTEEENLSRLRRKNKKLKRRRRMAVELANKQNSTIGEEEDVTPADNKEEEIQEATAKENIQLKNEEGQLDVENVKPAEENEEAKTNEESKQEDTPEDQCPGTTPTTDQDGSQSKVSEESKDVPQKLPPRKIEILPPPDKGILVAAGFREKTLDENNEKIIKGVKFADGINPGCGTSSSEGEEMTSPPPPSEMNAVPTKKSKMLRKRKIKVKIVRKVEEKKPEETKAEETKAEETKVEPEPEVERPPPPPSPPPCPSAAYPFCPPGILYQVCTQYAVLYAQAMAEKGIDIVFQPSTQIPTMGENLILSDTLGESLEAPENIDFPASESALTSVHDASYEHSSSNIPTSSESPVQTTGSRIPTIIRTANSPPMLDYGIDKSNCNLMISPVSNEILDNSILSSMSRKRSVSKNIVEVPIVDMACIPTNLLRPETVSQSDLNLDEIPLPMAMSPSKIPVPVGTPPLSFHISSKPKKYIGKSLNKHVLSSKLRNKVRSSLVTPKFVHSTPSSNIIVTPISDPPYEYNPYPLSDSPCHSQSTGLSPGPSPVSISVSVPPPHIPTIPPGVDLSRPPPSFTPPPPGTIDFSTPSPNSSVASALGNGSVSNNSSPNNVSSITSISIVPEEQNISSRTLQKEQDNDTAPPTPPPPGTSPRYVC